MRLNQWQFIGNLGNDPELRYTQSGKEVVGLSVAVNVSKKVGDEWEDNTIWVRVTAFGDRFKWLAEKAVKGNPVFVQGKLDISTYEAKDGSTRVSCDVLANDVQLLLRAADQGGGSGARNGQDHWGTGARPAPAAARQASPPRQQAQPQQRVQEAEDPDDLPFNHPRFLDLPGSVLLGGLF